MAIEQQLERIAVALEKIAKLSDAFGAGVQASAAQEITPTPAKPEKPAKPAKAETKAEPAKAEETKAEGPTFEDVRDALREYAAIDGRPAAVALLNKHGAPNINELKPEKYAAVIQEAKGA